MFVVIYTIKYWLSNWNKSLKKIKLCQCYYLDMHWWNAGLVLRNDNIIEYCLHFNAWINSNLHIGYQAIGIINAYSNCWYFFNQKGSFIRGKWNLWIYVMYLCLCMGVWVCWCVGVLRVRSVNGCLYFGFRYNKTQWQWTLNEWMKVIR